MYATAAVARMGMVMAEALGIEVVAEGIEHEDSARFLRERGARYGQGWLYSRAQPVDGQRAYLAPSSADC